MKGITSTAKNIIDSNLYLNLATTSIENQPWNSPLLYTYQIKKEDINLYWYSQTNSLHSRNIDNNSSVAITIYNSTATDNEIEAFYCRAKADIISDIPRFPDVFLSYANKMLKFNLLNKKSFTKYLKSITDFDNNSPLKFYKAIVKEAWILAPSKMYNEQFLDSRTKII